MTTPDMKTRKRRDHWAGSLRLVDALSPENQALVRPMLTQMRNEGIRATSIYSHAMALRKADEAVGGRCLGTIAPDNLGDIVAHLRANTAPSTAFIYTALVRAFYRRLLDVDDLPRAYERALACRRPARSIKGAHVPAEAFWALVEACRHVGNDLPGYPCTERNQAYLVVLHQAGFRASEALALRVGSVAVEGDDVLRLTLPEGAPDLKTGPRTVLARDARGIVARWLEVHPDRDDPRAPLFPTFPRAKMGLPVAYKTMHDLLRRLQDHAGVRGPLGRRYTLHDLRHTCATEAARNKWPEEAMRRYFGWGPGSAMPSVYIHLVLDDQRALLDAKPFAQKAPDFAGLLAQLAGLPGALAALTAALQGQPAAS